MLRCQNCDCLQSLRGIGTEVGSPGENVVPGERGRGCSWEDSDLKSEHALEKSMCGLGLFDSQ